MNNGTRIGWWRSVLVSVKVYGDTARLWAPAFAKWFKPDTFYWGVESWPAILAHLLYGSDRLERLADEMPQPIGQPSEGWVYRGRGVPRVRGKDKYKIVEKITGLPVLSAPDLLTTPEGALRLVIAWQNLLLPANFFAGDPGHVELGAAHAAQREQLTAEVRRAMDLKCNA